jgi:hypothetical protein
MSDPCRSDPSPLPRNQLSRNAELLQLGVFRPGLFQDGDGGIGVFPQREEILVGRLCLVLISRQDECSAQLQVRQSTCWITNNDAAMIGDFLEFRSGFGAPVRGQIGLATHIDGIKYAKETHKAAGWRAQLIGRSGL